jgi:hypothetical protein
MKVPNRLRIALKVTSTMVAALGVVALVSTPATPAAHELAANKYIGAAKCKNCHDKADNGDQYGAWEHAKHSKAFEVLGSDEAKKVAAELGIEDAQKAEQCVKCHVTAYGVDPKLLKKSFKAEMGVQCETCHGPGDAHLKARFKAAAAEDPDAKMEPGEIISAPTEEMCVKCHNSESPSFKAFCFNNMMQKIQHTDPTKAIEAKAVDCKSCHDPIPEEM